MVPCFKYRKVGETFQVSVHFKKTILRCIFSFGLCLLIEKWILASLCHHDEFSRKTRTGELKGRDPRCPRLLTDDARISLRIALRILGILGKSKLYVIPNVIQAVGLGWFHIVTGTRDASQNEISGLIDLASLQSGRE